MSAPTLYAALDPASLNPASRYIRESREALLAYDTEELAVLRFSIILTARWEASESEGPQRRAQLREELVLLRKHYGDKIDEIAMTYGVAQAMKAKKEVERTVVLPREIKVTGMPVRCEELEQEDTDVDFEV
ncbi:MAG: hypothetical protein WBC92_11140 [Terracidiphilus sp.]